MAPKQSKSRSHAPAVSDPRFSRAQNDPRFLRPKKETFQAVLDDRFKDLLTPGAGGTQHAGKSKVDKYGRKIRGDAVSADAQQLRTLYRLEGQRKDEDEDDDEDDEDDDEDGDEEEDDDDEEEEGEPQAGPTLDYARGEGQLLSSSDDDSDSSADDDLPSEDDYSSVDEDDLRASTADQQQARASGSSSSKELRGDRTRRIAVVNMDWDHIRARDLYMVFSSLVSPTATHLPASADATANAAASASGGKRVIGQALQVKGRVVSVRVYPSEFGRERMKKEDVEGPPRDIFKSADDMASSSQSRKNKSKKKRRRKGGDDEDDDEDEEEEITAKTIVQVDEGGDFDEEALRKYQLERLRYYYAVAEFDSVESASHVYNEIDGTEMERSANVFDLRFVPDEMSFPTYPLQADEPGQEDGWRDEVTFEDSANGGLTTTATTTSSSTTAASSSTTGKYRPLDFKTDALRHSRVKLTWDADDPERTRITKNVFAPGSKGKKNKGKKGANANVLTLDEMRDDDFRAYLASATEDEAEEGEEGGAGGEEGRARFRALLNLDGGVGNGDASDSDEDGKEAKTRPKSAIAAATAASSVWGRSRMPNAGGRPGQVEGEMEITFTPGLSEAKGRKESKLKLNKKGLVEAEGKGEGEGEESTLDKYKRKQREKKERKLAQRAVESTGDGVDDGKEKEVVEEEEEAAGGLGFDDPFFTNDGDVERAMAAALDAHDRGASESAVAGSAKAVVAPSSAPTNNSATVGTKSKTQSKREAKLERKRKRKAKGTSADDKDNGDVDGDDRDDDDGAAGANFDVDVSDPRFGALMEDHRFALDPSHKAWKETKGMRKLVDERRKKARRS
ncbi:unnamed protein product [Tilletia laevis]|uniref:NUC153 domain-containing protein n=1 Tax=Tilletia caries TaxID=13290 RepID=A0ABN7J808_9BASI|nr:unnamed protein product [Tilletia caries]CAD6920930.1 unnamed protein product [Tilletia laevis]CAD6954459.1 unnamed protein product [Tilletia caries]CAD7062717.1 unnamed protein product [Tilletia caries]